MKELQRKQKVRRAIYSWPSLVVLILITFFLVRGVWRVMEREEESRRGAQDLAEKVAALSSREQALKADLARLKTEEGIKGEIRERFNVSQDGEFVAVIVDEKGVSSSTDKSVLPWYKKAWSVIMGSQ